MSMAFTSALLHCEDGGLGACNYLLCGAAKVGPLSRVGWQTTHSTSAEHCRGVVDALMACLVHAM